MHTYTTLLTLRSLIGVDWKMWCNLLLGICFVLQSPTSWQLPPTGFWVKVKNVERAQGRNTAFSSNCVDEVRLFMSVDFCL